MRRNVKQVGIRLSNDDKNLVAKACTALSTREWEVSPSQLLYTAGLEEAASLGFTTSTLGTKVRQKHGIWRNKPERRPNTLRADNREKKSLTITIHPLHYRPISAAAEWAHVKVPTFLWGALLVFLSKRKKAEPQNTKLQRLELPTRYERG